MLPLKSSRSERMTPQRKNDPGPNHSFLKGLGGRAIRSTLHTSKQSGTLTNKHMLESKWIRTLDSHGFAHIHELCSLLKRRPVLAECLLFSPLNMALCAFDYYVLCVFVSVGEHLQSQRKNDPWKRPRKQ